MRSSLLQFCLLPLTAALSLTLGCVDTSVDPITEDKELGQEGTHACGELAAPEKVVLGYLPTWSRPEETFDKIDWNTITHINIAFGNPVSELDSTIEFGIDREVIRSWVQTAHSHDVKVLTSLAGINHSELVHSFLGGERQTELVDSLVATVEDLDLDGVDVDIEGNSVDETYGPFVQELAARLRPQGKLVTAAVGAWFQTSIKDDALFCFDFINIMSYDKTGTWTQPGDHSPYLTAVTELNYWKIDRDYDEGRIVLGVPFYGYCWGDACPSGYTSYRRLLASFPEALDSDFVEGDGYSFSHNTQATIARKTKKAFDYGGIMIWELSQDVEGADSLFSAVAETVSEIKAAQ